MIDAQNGDLGVDNLLNKYGNNALILAAMAGNLDVVDRHLKEIDVKDAILIVERGSDVEGELLYFSIKENNAANAGAKALIDVITIGL